MEIYTIGYGNLRWETFQNLLQKYDISVLVDIRTNPFSRFNPSFRKKEFEMLLSEVNIEYLFLGSELGGKPKDPQVYDNGKLNYSKVMRTVLYNDGLETLRKRSAQTTVCVMCAELDPQDCHRASLVGKSLLDEGVDVNHILKDGSIVKQSELFQPTLF